MSNTNRQAAFKARQKALGLTQLNIWVPEHRVAELQRIAEMMRADADLEAGPCRNVATGRLVSLKG